jgi:hypothetical protein
MFPTEASLTGCIPRPLVVVAVAVFSAWFNAAAQEPSLEAQYLELLKERDELTRKVRVLRDESELAGQKRPYLVIDLQSKQLTLRVQGLAVKSIPLADVRRMGRRDCASGVTVLEEFEAPRAPKLEATGEPAPEVTVAVSDMPQAYNLGFAAGEEFVNLSIRPVPESIIAETWLAISAGFSYTSGALGQAVGLTGPSYQLLLPAEDAQALFWSIEKGTQAILVCD